MLERFSDPVCGVEVNPMNCEGQQVYLGHTYYFCSPEHQAMFEQNPEDFVHKETAIDTTPPMSLS